jgi:pyruvate/oxaloacetate carboxyltransferase
MVYCNIWDVCIRDGVNCMCATSEEAERMAEVISVIDELAHKKKPNSSFRTAVGNRSRRR